MKKKDAYNVAIAGVTGAVGQEMLSCLENRDFPVNKLRLLASKRSVGREFTFQGLTHKVEELTKGSFEGMDIVLFSAGGDRAKEFAPAAIESGAVVVDNSSAFRMDDNTPLVVPEVNRDDIFKHNGVIANPNCTTILMLVALKPLYDLSRIRRTVVSTYQSASGAGAKAMDELKNQSAQVLKGDPPEINEFQYQIAFNLFSHDSDVGEDGYCKEEQKMINETHKMMHDPQIGICPTCIRVPLFRAHAEAITIEQERKVTVEEARKALEQAPGVKVVDNRADNHFPMPLEATGQEDVLVGRLREDPGAENSLALFLCGDQLLKGAALNAVQIAEELV